MFGGKMAAEIAVAAAARENKVRRESSFEDAMLSSNSDGDIAAPTDTRARNRTLMSRRPTPPKILPTAAAAESQQTSEADDILTHQSPSPLKSPKIPPKADPPGWNSKWAPNTAAWMEQQVFQKSGTHPVPYKTTENTSFHAPLQSWVPLVDKERRNRVDKPIHSPSNTAWLQSEATRTTVEKSVPVKSWQSGKRPPRPKPKLDDPTDTVSHSWAPHLHPEGVDAARLEASMTHISEKDSRHSRSRSRKSRDTAVSSSYDGTMIDDSDYSSESMGSTTSSEMIEVVDSDSNSDSKTGIMNNHRVRRNDSKVTMASSIISQSNSDSRSSSEDTFDVFAKARKAADASKSRTGSRVTFVGEVTGGEQNIKGSKSTDDEGDEESEEEVMERGGDTADFTTYLVDAEDTFQVFDEDCHFAPSRGTLCVLCLCIVVAAQGVAIGLYFALR